MNDFIIQIRRDEKYYTYIYIDVEEDRKRGKPKEEII